MNGNCIVDENILFKYFMPDITFSLIDFDFYIASKCKLLSSDDIQRIVDSFKTHRVFTNHHWTNVKCFFDPIMSYQHLSSTTIIKPKFFDGVM